MCFSRFVTCLCASELTSAFRLQYAADAARYMFNLPMQIVAAEYQFDRTKLFVFYTANSRVDFRELVKNVFATFKTCIWLKKVNRNQPFEPKPFATNALRTGVC